MSRFSADLSSSATDTKSLDQGHVYNMFLCLCVCVFYLGTAVRVTSGTCLELADPKLLLLGIRGYRKTHTEQKLIKKIKTHMLLTRLTNQCMSSGADQYTAIRKPSSVHIYQWLTSTYYRHEVRQSHGCRQGTLLRVQDTEMQPNCISVFLLNCLSVNTTLVHLPFLCLNNSQISVKWLKDTLQ